MNPRHILSWKSRPRVVLPEFRTARAGGLRRGLPTRPSVGRSRRGARAWRREIAEAVHRANSILRANRTSRRLAGRSRSNFATPAARLSGLDVACRMVRCSPRFEAEGNPTTSTRPYPQGVAWSWSGAIWGPASRREHWLYRRGARPRLLVQRLRHVACDPHSAYSIRRGPSPVGVLPPPPDDARRVGRPAAPGPLGAAGRAGGSPERRHPLAGPELPSGATARERPDVPRQHLGRPRRVQARLPVVFLFASHLPGGCYALTIDPPPRTIEPGSRR